MITIGIASYNQQEYLPNAIESCLDQTVNCKIICCNDGSTDNSLEIAKKYPIRVINQVNKGLASARNTILMNCDTDYLIFLDADDMLMDNCVEKLITKIKETDSDIVAPSFKEFGLSNNEVILMPNPKLEDFRSGNRIGYLSAIRKSKLLEVGGYNPRMLWGYEDIALTCLLLSRGSKIVTIPEVLWLYRTKDKSMITEAKEHHAELLAQINKDVPEAQLNF